MSYLLVASNLRWEPRCNGIPGPDPRDQHTLGTFSVVTPQGIVAILSAAIVGTSREITKDAILPLLCFLKWEME